MRIVCPSCHATYEVPKSLLREGGQIVRCACCDTEWTPELPQPGTAPMLIPPTLATLHAQGAERDKVQQAPAIPQLPATRLPETRLPATQLPEIGDEAEPAPPPRPAGRLGERLAARQKRLEPSEPAYRPVSNGSMRVSVLSRRMQLISVLAWVASVAVLIAAVATIYVRRHEIQAIWPASERLYKLLGLT
jgi:predicted Zn finger-like uncharacterized protein